MSINKGNKQQKQTAYSYFSTSATTDDDVLNIQVFNGLGGSGKSTLAQKNILDFQNKSYVVACLTKDLCNQWETVLTNPSHHPMLKNSIPMCNLKSINMDNTKTVNKDVLTELRYHAENSLIITHKTLYTCKFSKLVNDKHLIIDEVLLDIFKNYSYTLNNVTSILKLFEFFMIDESDTSNELTYSIISTGKRIARENKRYGKELDSCDSAFYQMFMDAKDGHKIIVTKKLWDRLVNKANGSIDDDGDKANKANKANKVEFIRILSPEMLKAFASVTIMSADFYTSFNCTLWQQYYNVNFTSDSNIQQIIGASEHVNGKRLTVTLLNDAKGTRTLRESNDETYGNIGNKMLHLGSQVFGDEPFVYVHNDNFKATAPANGQEMKIMSNGNNSYREIDNFLYLATLNPNKMLAELLHSMGITDDAYKTAVTCNNCYQSAMRTSMRNHNAVSNVKWVISDRFVFDFIVKKFPGCNQIEHEDMIRVEAKEIAYKQIEKNSRNKASKLLNDGYVGELFGVKNYLKRCNTNNIIKENDKLEVLKNIKYTDGKIIAVNLETEDYCLTEMLKELHISAVGYYTKDIYTIAVMCKEETTVEQLNRALNEKYIKILGNVFYTPVHIANRKADEMFEYRCSKANRITLF